MSSSLEVDIDVEDDDNNNNMMTEDENKYPHIRYTGHCCFCCCDYRRGVWILDVVLLGFSLIGFFYTLAAEAHLVPWGQPNVPYDEDTEAAFEEYMANSNLIKYSIVASGISAFVIIPLSIYGALKFKWCYIVPHCLWLIINPIISQVLSAEFCQGWHALPESEGSTTDCSPKVIGYIFVVIQTLLFVYPHFVFIRQCRNGKMTPSTYESREKSCCCGI